jgi:hypothetical protein
VLNKEVDGKLVPIAFFSGLLAPFEREYSIYEEECLAVILGCENFCNFLNIRSSMSILTMSNCRE